MKRYRLKVNVFFTHDVWLFNECSRKLRNEGKVCTHQNVMEMCGNWMVGPWRYCVRGLFWFGFLFRVMLLRKWILRKVFKMGVEVDRIDCKFSYDGKVRCFGINFVELMNWNRVKEILNKFKKEFDNGF